MVAPIITSNDSVAVVIAIAFVMINTIRSESEPAVVVVAGRLWLRSPCDTGQLGQSRTRSDDDDHGDSHDDREDHEGVAAAGDPKADANDCCGIP